MNSPAMNIGVHASFSIMVLSGYMSSSGTATKVHLVKAMVSPVVMYGCESWTIKKAETKELMLLNCGVGEES